MYVCVLVTPHQHLEKIDAVLKFSQTHLSSKFQNSYTSTLLKFNSWMANSLASLISKYLK